MSLVKDIVTNLPEVKGPLNKKLPFKEKLKWTLIILVSFYILSNLPLYGLGQNALAQFEQLSIILGASFGSILSLGIGPIVTASIVLQLLKGSGLVKLDLTTTEGKKLFQGVQKILAIFFILFEAAIYIFLGGLSPDPTLAPAVFRTMEFVLVTQLVVGGLLVLFMDEVMSKWGFGSGVSLFIAAGVASELMVRALSPLNTVGSWAFGSGQPPVGRLWVFFISLLERNPAVAMLAFMSILTTIIIFGVAVYAQSMKVEIPLSFGRIRGYSLRWPLAFLYTSNIPVILVAALLANVQLWARLLQNWGYPILGTFAGSVPSSGLVAWLQAPDLVNAFFTGTFTPFYLLQAFIYMAFMIVGSIIFSVFWVQTSGMDAKSQANQIIASGLQVPGFRKDPRVIESILSRYILPLTLMGGASIGFLAASADLLGALSRGTGILLAVMIVYRLYEDISKQHMVDMFPALRKIMEK